MPDYLAVQVYVFPGPLGELSEKATDPSCAHVEKTFATTHQSWGYRGSRAPAKSEVIIVG